MNFHGIEQDSMLNGSGLRVVLWVSGCNHHCKGCQNPQTQNPQSGILFTDKDLNDLLKASKKDYCSGLTLSGGDPLFPSNREEVLRILKVYKNEQPDKTVWLYTGYLWEEVKDLEIIKYVDVLVDGEFILDLADIKYHWAGSRNQRVIDVKSSLEKEEVVLYNG